MNEKASVENPAKIEDLYAAFEAADSIVLKKHITHLSQAPCIQLAEELQTIAVGDNVSLYRVARIIYDKTESIRDKLTTVYSTVFSLDNCSLAMLIRSHKTYVDLFVGVATRNFIARSDGLAAVDKRLTDSGKVLRNAFLGNFPGSELQAVNNISANVKSSSKADSMGKKELILDAFENTQYISAVSSIPAIRNAEERKNQEFIQGLEKLIDTLRGREYTCLILADVVGNDKIEQMCAQYEDLYSQLAPFKGSSLTVNEQNSRTSTESIIQGVTNTTNKTLSEAMTQGTSMTKTHTDTVGGSVTVGGEFEGPVKILKKIGVTINASISANYSHAMSRAKATSESQTNTTSTSSAKSLTEQNSVANALSSTSGESLQINYENRAVKTLLERIDEQIKRMRSCEDFGMFDTCAYFAAKEYDVAIAAASVFKSLTRGENSSVESSAVNLWQNAEDVQYIKEYLMRFYHPEFFTLLDATHHYPTTAAMLISGKEMAYQMALPKRSVAGVPVMECAEFGREVVCSGEFTGNLPLGNVYHMRTEENKEVRLDSNLLASHTFVTGSTGSGKSTTIYKILNETSRLLADGSEKRVKFMVVESAKGEYRKALAKNRRFHLKVYGTNPKITKMLRINPFRFPSDKIHISEHLDKLTEIFNVCWPMYAAMPVVLKIALENAYRNAGWNLLKSENKNGDVFPSFIDVAIEVRKYIDKSEYSQENKSNYKGSLLTRLESLTTGINAMVFTPDDLDDSALFEENVVIDLSRVGSTETKSLIMGLLVLKLHEYRKAYTEETDVNLQHVTVLEEAHNLLKRTSAEQSAESSNLLGKSVEMLANAIAEMRTYGEGFIIADQSPGLLDQSVIRNTNTKIIMQLPDQSDRELVGKAAGLNDDQIMELAKLPRGVAAVYQSNWVEAVLCKVEKPNLKFGCEDEAEEISDVPEEHILFDLLDPKFRASLDDLGQEEEFRNMILRASVPTTMKLKLLDFLKEKKSAKSVKILSSLLFDYFENAKDILEKTANEVNPQDLKTAIMAELRPSIMEYDDAQINLLITLVIREYMNRYFVDYPVWREFVADMIERNLL